MSEFVCHKSRFMHHILCVSPCIKGFLRHTTPHFMAYFGVIFFANMGDGGGQNYFQKFQAVLVLLLLPGETRARASGLVLSEMVHRHLAPKSPSESPLVRTHLRTLLPTKAH